MLAKVGTRWPVAFVVWVTLSFAAASTARATPTLNAGETYDNQCFLAGVPMPPNWATTSWQYNGTLPVGQSFENPTNAHYIFYFQSSGTSPPFDGETGPNPPGLCVAFPQLFGTSTNNSPQALDSLFVLCQGTNGKACFWMWNAELPFQWELNDGHNGTYFCNAINPLTNAYTEQNGATCSTTGSGPFFQNPRIASRNGLDFLAGAGSAGDTGTAANCNGGIHPVGSGLGCERQFFGGTDINNNGGTKNDEACSRCHAGENMFINHPGTATDLIGSGALGDGNGAKVVSAGVWWPNAWPDPIVSQYQGLSGELYFPPYNPGPSNYGVASYLGGSSVCFSCHTQPTINANGVVTGGRGGRFPWISADLDFGPQPPSSFLNLTPNNYTSIVFDPAVTRTVQNCSDSSPQSCPNGAMPPNVINGTGTNDAFSKEVLNQDSAWLADVQATNYGGAGHSGYIFPQTGSGGSYVSAYGTTLDYASTYTQLEATATHFCWVTGIDVQYLYFQPNPLPTMSLQVVGSNWELVGTNNSDWGGTISAECAPWAAFFGSPITGYNSRGWTPQSAINSWVHPTYTYTSSPQPIQNSGPGSVCFISGIDGAYLTDGDQTYAAATLWWPGETEPNTYPGGSNYQWYVQLSNSSTEEFYNVHIGCIDIGMVDAPSPHNLGNPFNDWGLAGRRNGYGASPLAYQQVYNTAPMFGNACFYTQIVATGIYGSCYGNVSTSEIDTSLFTPNQPYNGATYSIDNAFPGGTDWCDTSVWWLYQNCLAAIP
jgi:hypothetical protein